MDVEDSLIEYMKNFTEGTGFKFRVKVDKEMCQINNKNLFNTFDKQTKIAG